MWVIMDWCDTRIIGPFDTIQAAEEWLGEKGVDKDELEHYELSIHYLCEPEKASIDLSRVVMSGG